jgi:hypothetical protein
LAIVYSDRGKAKMDAIRAQLSGMADEIERLRAQRLVDMDNSQRTALATGFLSGALGILLTIAIGLLVRRATLARRREEWLQAGQVGLATAMMGDQPVERLGNSILEFLARYADAVAGALFVGDGDVYRRPTAFPKARMSSSSSSPGRGFWGKPRRNVVPCSWARFGKAT